MHATFTAHGSSRPLPSLLPDCCRSSLPFPLGVRLQSRSSHLTYPSDFGSPFGSRQVVHQAHVCWLSPGPMPYPAGYEFPSPFGCWHSLLGPSFPAGAFRPSCVGPTGQTGPQRGFHVPLHREATGVGVLCTAGPLVSQHDTIALSCLGPSITVSALSVTWINAASTRIHLHSPVRPLLRPETALGWQSPWALPSASDPAVTGDALEG